MSQNWRGGIPPDFIQFSKQNKDEKNSTFCLKTLSGGDTYISCLMHCLFCTVLLSLFQNLTDSIQPQLFFSHPLSFNSFQLPPHSICFAMWFSLIFSNQRNQSSPTFPALRTSLGGGGGRGWFHANGRETCAQLHLRKRHILVPTCANRARTHTCPLLAQVRMPMCACSPATPTAWFWTVHSPEVGQGLGVGDPWSKPLQILVLY